MFRSESSATRKLPRNGVLGGRTATSTPFDPISSKRTSGKSARFHLSGRRVNQGLSDESIALWQRNTYSYALTLAAAVVASPIDGLATSG